MKYFLIVLSLFSSIAIAQPKTTITQTELPYGLPLPTAQPQGLPPQVMSIENFKTIPPKNPYLNFNEIPVSQLLVMFFNEINNTSYVLAPEVSEDKRVVSFRYDSKKDGSLKSFIENLLFSLDYQISIKNNVYYVSKKTEAFLKKEDLFYVYKPKYRDVKYLTNLIRPVYQSNISTTSRITNSSNQPTDSNASPTSATGQLDSTSDVILLHSDNQKDLDSIVSLLEKLDSKEKNYLLNAYIYEVSYSKNDASALGLILNIASNKLNLSLGTQDTFSNAIKLTSSSLSLLFSQINTDSRFKLLSNPYLRVKNNKSQKLIVGQSVPFQGETTFSNGTPISSTKLVDTGFILNINTEIKEENIDVQFDQQISEALPSPDNTPIITKRQLISNFTINKDEIVVLAGLTHNKTSKSIDKPFIMPFFTNTSDKTDTIEVVIFVKITEE